MRIVRLAGKSMLITLPVIVSLFEFSELDFAMFCKMKKIIITTAAKKKRKIIACSIYMS